MCSKYMSVKYMLFLSFISCGLTEWEREREKEEFSRAAMLYQPLKGDMAARFRRGKNIDDDTPDTVWLLTYFFPC